jgi:hypothetical protein
MVTLNAISSVVDDKSWRLVYHIRKLWYACTRWSLIINGHWFLYWHGTSLINANFLWWKIKRICQTCTNWFISRITSYKLPDPYYWFVNVTENLDVSMMKVCSVLRWRSPCEKILCTKEVAHAWCPWMFISRVIFEISTIQGNNHKIDMA